MKTDYQTFCPQGTPQKERRKLDVGDIFANQIKCKKCGGIIRSCNRHDFVMCGCGAVAVDGGSWYLKRIGNPNAIEEMSINYDDIKDNE
jgi:hypothetical protein